MHTKTIGGTIPKWRSVDNHKVTGKSQDPIENRVGMFQVLKDTAKEHDIGLRVGQTVVDIRVEAETIVLKICLPDLDMTRLLYDVPAHFGQA